MYEEGRKRSKNVIAHSGFLTSGCSQGPEEHVRL